MSQHAYLDKEQNRTEQDGDLANQRSRLNEIGASLLGSRAQRISLLAEMRRTALDSLNDAEQKAAVLQQDLLSRPSLSLTAAACAERNGIYGAQTTTA